MVFGDVIWLTAAIYCITVAVISATVPIDNGLVDNPTVVCGASAVAITLHTRSAYSGRVFVKGHSQERDCQALGDARWAGLSLSVPFDRCGMTRTRELNGVSVSTTVVISFHPIFITKVDRAYRVHCFYTEHRYESVTQAFGVDEAAFSTQALNLHREAPTCRYDILSGGASGSPVKYAKIGDLIYHKWTCDAPTPNVYCMRVHSCAVTDGQGGLPFYVLDENGCESDGYVFQSLYYISDLTAGQYAYVFKFADRPTLHFNCQVKLTMKPTTTDGGDQREGCRAVQPKCPSGNDTKSNYRTRPESVIAPAPIDESAKQPYVEVYGTKRTIDYSLNVQTVPQMVNNAPTIDYNMSTPEYGAEITTQTYSNSATTASEAWRYFQLNGAKYRLNNNSRNESSNPDEYLTISPALQATPYGSAELSADLSGQEATYNAVKSSTSPVASYESFYSTDRSSSLTGQEGSYFDLVNRIAIREASYGDSDPLFPQAASYGVIERPPGSWVEKPYDLSDPPSSFYSLPNRQIVPHSSTGPVSVSAPAALTPVTVSTVNDRTTAAPVFNNNVDPNYSKKTDISATKQRSTAFDFSDPTVDLTPLIRRAPPNSAKKDELVVISDVHVPEQSLVVVEIDENTLAQQLLHDSAANRKSTPDQVSSGTVSDGGCVSYAFFIAFSLVNALLAAGASALLVVVALGRWRVGPTASSGDFCADFDSQSSISGIYEIPCGRPAAVGAATPLGLVDRCRQYTAFQRENVGQAFGRMLRQIHI